MGDIRPGGREQIVRIWDLRRGDYDDNRTSPQVHGLRRILFSSALEFSYLRASISFLVLIVGPALLVGIAPSVVITYGRLKLEAASLVERSPIFALVLLGALVGAAFLLGRQLIRLIVDNFWELHYTLVFPIFIAVCEPLRMLAERIPSRATTPAQVHHRRRLATVAAALLLAGGGLALAIAVGLSFGLQLVNVRHELARTMAKAALVNAAVILGLSAAAESLYWLWRELGLNHQVLDWAPSPSTPDSPAVRVAHLSDPHLVGERYGYRMESGTHGPRGNRRIHRALRKLAAIHALNPLDHILVTGDVTDAGTRAEWAEFLDLLRGYPDCESACRLCQAITMSTSWTAPTRGVSICPGARGRRCASSASFRPWTQSRASAPTWWTEHPALSGYRSRITCARASARSDCARWPNPERCAGEWRWRRSGRLSFRWLNRRGGTLATGLFCSTPIPEATSPLPARSASLIRCN